jgi:hypothetical protein
MFIDKLHMLIALQENRKIIKPCDNALQLDTVYEKISCKLRLFSLAILLSPLRETKLNGKNENKQCLVTAFFRRRHD